MSNSVDHKAEAERLVRPKRDDPPIPASDGDVAEAQVHASLAIAEQLERLNDQLASVIGVSAKAPFGSNERYVRTSR